jgi:hypothetical protein
MIAGSLLKPRGAFSQDAEPSATIIRIAAVDTIHSVNRRIGLARIK